MSRGPLRWVPRRFAGGRPIGARENCSTASASATVPTRCRGICPAASSSASRSRARLPRTRACCCSMSRPSALDPELVNGSAGGDPASDGRGWPDHDHLDPPAAVRRRSRRPRRLSQRRFDYRRRTCARGPYQPAASGHGAIFSASWRPTDQPRRPHEAALRCLLIPGCHPSTQNQLCVRKCSFEATA